MVVVCYCDGDGDGVTGVLAIHLSQKVLEDVLEKIEKNICRYVPHTVNIGSIPYHCGSLFHSIPLCSCSIPYHCVPVLCQCSSAECSDDLLQAGVHLPESHAVCRHDQRL